MTDLFGQEGPFTDLVAECVGYPKRRLRNRDLPIIMLLGPRGSGKTDRLERLESTYAGIVPTAHLDLASKDYMTSGQESAPRRVLVQLMFLLGEKWQHFGRLKFPRLKLGLLALSSPLDLLSRDRALNDVRRLLDSEDQVVKVKNMFDELPDLIQEQQKMLPGSSVVVRLALRSLAPIILRHVILRKALSWYGDRIPERPKDPYDALIKLNSKDRRGQDSQREVDETLCEAFLTDLYAEYNEGIRHWDRFANCLILLDNIDSAPGESFLRLLLAARHRRALESPNSCDPLVVVATRRHRTRPYDEGALRADSTDKASYSDWLRVAKRSRERAGRLYLIESRALTLQEVERVIQEMDMPRIPAGFARFVHRLTEGSPGVVSLVLQAVKGTLETRPTDFDLRKVLELSVRNGSTPASSVARRALDDLLKGMNATQRSALITCAGARDVDAAAGLEILGNIPRGTVGKLYEILQAEVWTTRSTVRSRREFLTSTFLHRALLHELATRREPARGTWTAVHTALRNYYQEAGEPVMSMHHSLALEDFEELVAHFDQTFREGHVGDWIAEMATVTSAPNRLHVQPHLRDLSPLEQVQAVTAGVGDDSPQAEAIGRLIAALWISADPLIIPDERLVSLIIDELTYLEHLAGRDFMVLFNEVRRYQRVMELWHQ